MPFLGSNNSFLSSPIYISKINMYKAVPCCFKFSYLGEPSVFMKEMATHSMESFCKKICLKKGLDYEAHTLEYGEKEHRPIEMDQPFYKYAVKNQFSLHLVRKTKKYSAVVTIENDEETLVCNYIEGK